MAGLLGVVVALCLLPSPARAAGRVVTFRANDGRTISALMLKASQRPAPAVVLAPMLGRSKDDWQAVAQRLADAGITSLAVDLPAPSLPADPNALVAWHEDIGAAVGYLASQPEVRPGALGLAGASLGANLAALAAAANPDIRSLALVSPSLDYRGVRIEAAMKQYGQRPALLVASLRDPYAARSVRELVKDAPGPREVRWSETPAHGAVLLARDPALISALVEWFQRTLIK